MLNNHHCDACGADFDDERQLKSHERDEHKRDIPAGTWDPSTGPGAP